MQWLRPPLADRSSYIIERTVDGIDSALISPTLITEAGTVTLTDDVTVPYDTCPTGWTPTAPGRCAPGLGITVSYRISYSVAGWTPEQPLNIPSVVARDLIATGAAHTCATTGGGLACWGANGAGQLGDNTPISRPDPAVVATLEGATITALAAGDGHTCAATTTRLSCWGENTNGQLGDATTDNRLTPTPVPTLDGMTITALTAGSQHTCAATTTGVYCWGWNGYGQVGVSPEQGLLSSSTPVRVTALDGTTVTALAAGKDHTCAATTTGVYCWGFDGHGQLGRDTISERGWDFEPDLVPALVGRTGTALAAGGYETCASTDDGAYCWGQNSAGQLGNGESDDDPHPSPSRLSSFDGRTVIGFAVGASHACATTGEGVSCWGYNDTGQLGNGTTSTLNTVPTPHPVDALAGRTITTVAAADRQTCARITDSATTCWGHNNFGQLGDGTTNDRAAPVTVRLPSETPDK